MSLVDEVVAVAAAAAVLEHLAAFDPRVKGVSPLGPVTVPPFHRTQTQFWRSELFAGFWAWLSLGLSVWGGVNEFVWFKKRCCRRFGGFFRIGVGSGSISIITWLAAISTLFEGFEVVGVSEAAAVEEPPALLFPAVEEVAWHQPPARTRLVLQVAGTLILFHHTHLLTLIQSLEVVGVALAAPVLKALAATRVDVEVEPVLHRFTRTLVLLQGAGVMEDVEAGLPSISDILSPAQSQQQQ